MIDRDEYNLDKMNMEKTKVLSSVIFFIVLGTINFSCETTIKNEVPIRIGVSVLNTVNEPYINDMMVSDFRSLKSNSDDRSL